MIPEGTKIMQETSKIRQYLTALIVNLLTIVFGITEGWTSPTVLLLTSKQTPLASGIITMESASWLASLMCVGCLFGNIFFAYSTNKFGRKWPLLIISVPTIVSWMIVLYAPNVYYLYAARVIGGFFGGGGYVIVPLFLAEIADDRVRGFLVSTLNLTENFGILLAFIFGYFFDFYMTPKFIICLAILFGISFYFFPESPQFLVKQKRIFEAEKSIRFYQSLREGSEDDQLVELEINKLKKNINHEEKSAENTMKWSDLKTKPVQKAMTIGVVMVALNQFSGCVAMLNYTATIFEEAGSNMSPNLSAIIVGIIQVCGTLIATNIVDRAGRKFLLAISNFGTAIGLTTLGFYMMLKSWGVDLQWLNWLPVLSFSFVIFLAALGIFIIPIIVLSEIMPEKVKDFCVSICMSLLWISSFLTIKYLPLMTETIGFHGSMYLFAGVCVACELFIILFVPETKAKSHEQIMESLQ